MDIDRLAEGDELIIEDETVLVLRRGRPWVSLSGRAFLWSHRKVFQADFWRAMLGFRRAVPRQAGSQAAAVKAAREPASPTMAVLDRLLVLFRENDVDFAGSSLAAWTHQKDGRATLRLEGDAEIQLTVEVAAEGTQALWTVGPFALAYPSESPLSTKQQWAAAEAFRGKLLVALKKIAKQQSRSV